MERNPLLQALRFAAAALVLCTHATFYYHERIDRAVAVWHFGEVGVPIFFVISGVVMVVSTRRLPPGAAGARLFMLRRVVRIVPLWWAALSVKVAVALLRPDVVNHNFFQFDHALKSYLFIPYFNEQHLVEPLHGVGWTLLHEMFFYIVFALALGLRLRPAMAASAVVLGFWLAGAGWNVDHPAWSVATSPANLYFILGMAVGSALMNGQLNVRLLVGFALALLAVAVTRAPGHWQVPANVPVVLALATAVLLWPRNAGPGAFAALGRLGDSSYTLYLFHPFIAPAAVLVLGRLAPGFAPGLHIAATVLFTVAAAHLLHLWVEVPLVRWARARLIGSAESGRSGAQPAW